MGWPSNWEMLCYSPTIWGSQPAGKCPAYSVSHYEMSFEWGVFLWEMSTQQYTCLLYGVLTINANMMRGEGLPGSPGVGGGGSLVPPNFFSTVHTAFVPVFPALFFFCSLVPNNSMTMLPCSLRPQGNLPWVWGRFLSLDQATSNRAMENRQAKRTGSG